MANEESIIEEEKKVLAEERQILREEKRILANLKLRTIIQIGGIGALLIGLAAGGYWWVYSSSRVFTDKADVEAPLIGLGPTAPGVLKEIFVREGDAVKAYLPLARVGDTYVTSNTDGLVISVENTVGRLFSPGMPIVTIINPKDLRVVAKIDENAGFSDVLAGERAVFTVDAFGGKQFEGIVDEISPSAVNPGVVFNISDKRAVKEFAVKIKYDAASHPEILNGMSARVWIYKQ